MTDGVIQHGSEVSSVVTSFPSTAAAPELLTVEPSSAVKVRKIINELQILLIALIFLQLTCDFYLVLGIGSYCTTITSNFCHRALGKYCFGTPIEHRRSIG